MPHAHWVWSDRLAGHLCGMLLVAVWLLAPGCRPAAVNPRAVVLSYAALLEAGRYREAYQLMAPEFRKGQTEVQFVRTLRAHPAQLKAVIAGLRAEPATVRVAAELRYGQGASVALEASAAGWRISNNPLDFYSQRTPADALRSFVRAVQRRRYDIVLRFVPAKWAQAMSKEKLRTQWAEIESLVSRLKPHLDAEIQQSGDTATMPYGEQHEVRFVREDGLWKILDPD